MDIEKLIDDLCLIENVMVDYSLGRRRGLTDEEAESRAIKAVNRAMEALEKQVPKEPIRQSTWKACPVCTLGIGVNDKTPNPGAIRYCYHCGQRLSWSK